jgi:hypothetical protein
MYRWPYDAIKNSPRGPLFLGTVFPPFLRRPESIHSIQPGKPEEECSQRLTIAGPMGKPFKAI